MKDLLEDVLSLHRKGAASPLDKSYLPSKIGPSWVSVASIVGDRSVGGGDEDLELSGSLDGWGSRQEVGSISVGEDCCEGWGDGAKCEEGSERKERSEQIVTSLKRRGEESASLLVDGSDGDDSSSESGRRGVEKS